MDCPEKEELLKYLHACSLTLLTLSSMLTPWGAPSLSWDCADKQSVPAHTSLSLSLSGVHGVMDMEDKPAAN